MFCPLRAAAEAYKVEFSGTVTTAVGIFSGQGTVVTGYYVIEDDLVDATSQSDVDLFEADINPDATYEISVTVGTATRTTADNANTPGTLHHSLDLQDRTGINSINQVDEWKLRSTQVDSNNDDQALLMFHDDLPQPEPDALFVGSDNLTGTVVLSPGDLSLYSALADSSFVSQYLARDAGTTEGAIFFRVDTISEPMSLSPQAVPMLGPLGIGALSMLLAAAGVWTLRSEARRRSRA